MHILSQQRLFALSPVVASGAAYLLNLALIYILNDKVEYSHFLSLNSWAVYLSTFAYLLILDLYLGPNREHYDLEALLGFSGLCILWFTAVLLAVGLVARVQQLLVIALAVLGFAGFKLTCQYYIYAKHIGAAALVRYLRAALILIAIAVLMGFRDQLPLSGASQVALQGGICVIVVIVAHALFGLFRQAGMGELTKVVRFDGRRLLKRNSSLLIDTIHMPVLFLFVSSFSSDLPALFIYALGVLLPAAYVISTLLREQVLVRDGLVERLLATRRAHMLLPGYGVTFITGLIFAAMSTDHALVGLALLLSMLVTLSGALGTVLYRHGRENFDLAINLLISGLLAVLYWFSLQPGTVWVVNLCLLCLLLKFCMQMLVALGSTRMAS